MALFIILFIVILLAMWWWDTIRKPDVLNPPLEQSLVVIRKELMKWEKPERHMLAYRALRQALPDHHIQANPKR